MDEHTEHAKCMVPTGKQDTTNIKTHREVSLNGPENVQQINTMLHWPCTHRQILQMIHPDPRNWLPLQSHNPNPPTCHICRLHNRDRYILGYGRHAQWGRLTGTHKGINKLIKFIRCSNMFDKHNNTWNHNTNERGNGKSSQEASPT